MELIAAWWAAVLAASICAVPATVYVAVFLLAPIETLPERPVLVGGGLEVVGKVAVPIAAPRTAALLAGPAGDFGVRPSVTSIVHRSR